MMMWTLICAPGEVFRDFGERAAALEYEKMAIKGYDQFVKFDTAYEQFKDKPDLISTGGFKNRRLMTMTSFLNQPIVRVGDLQTSLDSSSYLIGPTSREGKMLPDLDIAELRGELAPEAIQRIADFYHTEGWLTHIFKGTTEPRAIHRLSAGRRKGLDEVIVTPHLDVIKSIAIKHLKYRPDKFAFMAE